MRAHGHDRLLGLFLAGSAAVHAGALLLPGISQAPGGQAAAPPAETRLHVVLLASPVHPAGKATARRGRPGAAAASERPAQAQGRPVPGRQAAGSLQRGLRSPAPRERRPRKGGHPPQRAASAPRNRLRARGAARPEVLARAGTPGAAPPAPGRSMAATPRPATPGPRLEAALRLRLAEHFRYPPLARRRGWEGTVRLGLRIEPDGRLTRVRVLAGSGYSVLDRAAARALERVGRVPEAAGWLGGRPFDMVLPVEYRLVSR